ncbi:hypothetical protein [Streptomyces sp. NPDC001635]
MWIDALKAENLLAEGATTVAYSYIGPALTEQGRFMKPGISLLQPRHKTFPNRRGIWTGFL